MPTLHLVTAPDEGAAVRAAERLMADGPHHRGAELWREGRRLRVLDGAPGR